MSSKNFSGLFGETWYSGNRNSGNSRSGKRNSGKSSKFSASIITRFWEAFDRLLGSIWQSNGKLSAYFWKTASFWAALAKILRNGFGKLLGSFRQAYGEFCPISWEKFCKHWGGKFLFFKHLRSFLRDCEILYPIFFSKFLEKISKLQKGLQQASHCSGEIFPPFWDDFWTFTASGKTFVCREVFSIIWEGYRKFLGSRFQIYSLLCGII